MLFLEIMNLKVSKKVVDYKNYLTFFKYKFFVFAWSDVKNKINIVPTNTENTVVTSKT